MELAARLHSEARRSNQRRLLVLAGGPGACRKRAKEALDTTGIPPSTTTYVGPSDQFPFESLSHHEADQLLGTSRDAVVYDCHHRCEPNALGKLVGTVSGGGLFVLLTPPLDEWPRRRNQFDCSLAVPPFEVEDVGTNFRRRLVQTLREHRGIAIVNAESGEIERDGCFDPPPRLPREEPKPPVASRFPRAVYDACRTQDQVDAVAALEHLRDSGEAVVVEANRGRGKSSAAGLAAGALATAGNDILVTAPAFENVAALFERATALLADLDSGGKRPDSHENSERRDDNHVIETETGRIRYAKPAEAAELPDSPDRVIVDEAAALPVRLLEQFLGVDSVAFTTTIHGYEGAGRGFSVRFRKRLDESRFTVREMSLAEPIRYAPADPIEVWSFRALALDARPAVEQLVADATPETVSYQELSGEMVRKNEQLLRELFGLLVLAHYRTEPNDLARLLDAPNVSVHCLTSEGHVVAVALVSQEGGLPSALRQRIYEGERIRGNLLPDVLMSQLRDEQAGEPTGQRVMRIATHTAVRSRGLGSLLLDHVRDQAENRGMDWLGVSYGATPPLASFWADNGFSTVHLSTTRNDRSGEHSLVMLDPLTEAGRALVDRHTSWFLQRTPAAIRESLATADPELIRAACRTADGVPPLDLREQEWRHAAGMAYGTSIFETAPRGTQRLAFRHLVAPRADCLDDEALRVLVRKGIQGQSWERIAEAESFHTESACMRKLGEIVGTLVELYGGSVAEAELERYR